MAERLVTAKQLREGYMVLVGSHVLRGEYRVIRRTECGDYVVEEPEFREAFDAS